MFHALNATKCAQCGAFAPALRVDSGGGNGAKIFQKPLSLQALKANKAMHMRLENVLSSTLCM
jgi:hypothetical protein